MGLMNKLLKGQSRTVDDYIDLNADDFETETTETGIQVKFTELSGRDDVMPIKDAVYDGNVVVADLTRHSTTDRTMEQISDELKQVAREVGGDVIQKGDEQLIITPTGIGISRSKL